MPLDPGTAVELALIALAALVYLGFFLGLGLLVSGIVRQPGTAILILLFLWVTLTLVIPNSSPLVAAQLEPLPSVASIEYQAGYITDIERDNRLDEETRPVWERVRKEYGIPSSVTYWDVKNGLDGLGWSEQQINDFLNVWSRQWNEVTRQVNNEQTAKAQALLDEVDRKVVRQTEIARAFSLLSPTSALTYLGTDLASVGIRGEEYFAEEVSNYRAVFADYIRSRIEEESERLGRPVGSNELLTLPAWPRFEHRAERIENRVEGVLAYAGLLALYTLVALAAAFVFYLRYDVR